MSMESLGPFEKCWQAGVSGVQVLGMFQTWKFAQISGSHPVRCLLRAVSCSLYKVARRWWGQALQQYCFGVFCVFHTRCTRAYSPSPSVSSVISSDLIAAQHHNRSQCFVAEVTMNWFSTSMLFRSVCQSTSNSPPSKLCKGHILQYPVTSLYWLVNSSSSPSWGGLG